METRIPAAADEFSLLESTQLDLVHASNASHANILAKCYLSKAAEVDGHVMAADCTDFTQDCFRAQDPALPL